MSVLFEARVYRCPVALRESDLTVPGVGKCAFRWNDADEVLRVAFEELGPHGEDLDLARVHAERISGILSLGLGQDVNLIWVDPSPIVQPAYYDLAERFLPADYYERRVPLILQAMCDPQVEVPLSGALRLAVSTRDPIACFVLLWGVAGFFSKGDSPSAVDSFLSSLGVPLDCPDSYGRPNRETKFGALRNELSHMRGRSSDVETLSSRARELRWELGEILWEHVSQL